MEKRAYFIVGGIVGIILAVCFYLWFRKMAPLREKKRLEAGARQVC